MVYMRKNSGGIDLIELFLMLLLAITVMGIAVYFIPVGGAPAALSTSAGIPTGAPMISIGLAVTGILSAVSVIDQSTIIMLMYGAVSSMIMITIVMFFSNIIHVYGVGVPLASSNIGKDPLTGFNQDEYVSPGTKGHGIQTVSFISGIVGALLAGIGGSLSFTVLFNQFISMNQSVNSAASMASIISLVLFCIMAVLSSYNIGGTIQGVYDKKFKTKIIPGLISSLIISSILSISCIIIIWGLTNV